MRIASTRGRPKRDGWDAVLKPIVARYHGKVACGVTRRATFSTSG